MSTTADTADTADTTTPVNLAGLLPLTKARVAIGLPVALTTCIRWARDGAIPATRIGGRWFIDPEALRSAVVRNAKP